MRVISSSSCASFSSSRAFFDFGESLSRSFASAFSTESLLILAMQTPHHSLAVWLLVYDLHSPGFQILTYRPGWMRWSGTQPFDRLNDAAILDPSWVAS